MKTVLVGAIAIYRSIIDDPYSVIEEIETTHSNLWVHSLTYGSNETSDFRTSSEIINIPKDINLNYPSASLMKNEKYANSYRQEAMKIKKRKIWLNAGLGAGIIIIPILILLSSGDGILP